MHNISYRSNQKISSKNVRVVDPDGVNLGILELDKALSLAENYGLDLVEISPESNPPVCRIISLSKLKYQAQIKIKETKKGSTRNEVKEIKIRPVIEDHDYKTKLTWARKFLKAGNTIRVTILIKGREVTHPEQANKIYERFINDISDMATLKGDKSKFGKDIIFMLEPIK